MEPKYLTLSELLQNRLFRIPSYQRPYSWQSKQREDLFNDLLSVHSEEGSFHFMATIVGLNRHKQELGTDIYQVVDVVDGQQRLTTLILLLKAIELSLPEDGDERQKLKSQLVKADGNALVLLQTNHDYSGYFQDYMRNGEYPEANEFESAADKNIVEGIHSAVRFVADWEQKTGAPLPILLASVKNRLKFVFHALDNERMVYTVFEILNTRGLPVAWLDRCKAALMGIVFDKAQNKYEMIKELHDIWSRIYRCMGLRQSLSSESLRFAATLWSSNSLSKVCSDADALEIFRDACNDDPNNTIAISNFIETVADATDKLLADTKKSAVTKIGHARLLAIAIELRFSGKEEERLLQQWENTTFRIFGLCRRDSRTAVGDYVRLARSVYGGGEEKLSFDECMNRIKQLGTGKGDFSARRAAEQMGNTDCYDGWEESLRYFFYARERWLDAQSSKPTESTHWNKIWQQNASDTIEHILPQNPDADSDWSKLLDEAGLKAEEVCHRLGNLVLLPKPLNSQAKNDDFSKKREIYRGHGLAITDEVCNSIEWNIRSIEQRENMLIDWAAEYWADLD